MQSTRVEKPKNILEVKSVSECEKWRGIVVRDISRKVTKIHDPSLTDFQVRDLNDVLNSLLREKGVWEIQIRNLGGPNYGRGAGTQFDAEGKEVPGNRGYKYFGRAKDLPGVKELFEEARTNHVEPKRKAQLIKNVNADYYGYRDEDTALLEFEAQQEEIAVARTIKSPDGLEKDWVPVPPIHHIPSQKEVENWLRSSKKDFREAMDVS